jgi:predicted DNA-binding protein
MTPNRPTITDTPEHQPGPTSRRIKITLPTVLANKLDQLARRAGEPPAKVAAQIIRRAIDNDDLDAAPPTRRDTTRSGSAHDDDDDGRPPLA